MYTMDLKQLLNEREKCGEEVYGILIKEGRITFLCDVVEGGYASDELQIEVFKTSPEKDDMSFDISEVMKNDENPKDRPVLSVILQNRKRKSKGEIKLLHEDEFAINSVYKTLYEYLIETYGTAKIIISNNGDFFSLCDVLKDGVYLLAIY